MLETEFSILCHMLSLSRFRLHHGSTVCTSLNEASSALFRTDGNIRSAQRKSISAKCAALPVTFHYTGTEKSTCPVTFQSVNYLELDHQIFAALLLKDFLIHNFDLSCQVLAINFFFICPIFLPMPPCHPYSRPLLFC